MLQQRLLILMWLLLLRAVWLVKASTRPNHLNSISDSGATSAMGPAATVYNKSPKQQQPSQQAWQPSAARSNWIILQAATAGGATNHRYDAHNDFQLQRLPINYYAYNRSAGNYHRPLPASPTSASSSAHLSQPYVLALSKVRRKPVPLVSAGVDKQPQDSSSTFVTYNDRNNNGNNKIDASHARNSNDDGDNAPQTRRQDIDSRNRNSLNNGNGIDIRDADDGDEGASSYEMEAELNNILLPLENAVDRVRHLCDVVKRIVSDVDEDTDDQNYSASSMSNTVAFAARNDVPAIVSAEVQGRTLQPSHSLANSSTATTSVGTGRGKKLKKKLKKLLLPLLIAYKLKFLTLIPVLIGGLTLLVGTTGLAGFFFALFTAVMSLKSGGGKSFVMKKT